MHTENAITFPEDFRWGASTAAFLMEGEPLADGAGPSIQHTFRRTPGNRPRSENPDGGIGHYRRFHEDVALARDLGLQTFRFSVAWPRVFPEGTGGLNTRGLDHYDALVDALLEAGIEPFPYLYYWDLPAALQDRGGWANRDCARWFADYASTVFERLGDRVPRWLTICEPWSIVHFGHLLGEEAPGVRDLRTALRAGHHLLLGHGLAVEAYRASDANGEIGLSTVMTDIRPASPDERDVRAAERTDTYCNRLFLDPVMRGAYPAAVPAPLLEHWPHVADRDLEAIATPIDFLGVVYYLRLTIADVSSPSDGADAPPAGFEHLTVADLAAIERQETVFADLLGARVSEPAGPVTDLGWEIAPDGLTSVLASVRDRYGNPPVYVAENGAAFADTVGADGVIADEDRRSYLDGHLRAAHDAVRAGVDLRGWSVWSLLDDAEHRFGLVHVDRETHRRTIKSSGHWYRAVIAANGPARTGAA